MAKKKINWQVIARTATATHSRSENGLYKIVFSNGGKTQNFNNYAAYLSRFKS